MNKFKNQIYVIYDCKSFQDGVDILEACKNKVTTANDIEKYFHQPYLPNKNWLIGFTRVISGGYMSNNEVECYHKLIVTKRQFIFYMLNKIWDTFFHYELIQLICFSW